LKILFLGTSDFAVHALKALHESHQIVGVVTQPDRGRTRKGKMIAPPAKACAQRLGLPIMQPENINDPDCLDQLAAFEPDVTVVVAFGQKLGREILELAPLGAVNLHGSLLPAYRGAAPINRAIADGLTETGLTIFRITADWDAGDILAMRTVEIGPDETAGELYDRMAIIGSGFFVETVNAMAEDRLSPMPQNVAGVTRAPKLRKEEGELRLDQCAEVAYNLFRAVTPKPGAYTFWQATSPVMRIKLLGARRGRAEAAAPPGRVIGVGPDGIEVACARGSIIITRLQAPGGKPLSARDFLNGHPVKINDQMGR